MAELAWPADLGHGTFIGRFGFMDADSHDPDREPDITSATGGTVTITPSIRSVRYTGAQGPMILAARPAKGVIDSEGYLCTSQEDGTPGDRGMVFPATDDTDLTPTDWTYEVSIILDGQVRIGTFNVKLPEGATVYLSLAVPVPSSGGTAVVVDPTTAERAEVAADRAEAAADEAEGYAPTFVWDGTALVIDGGTPVDLKGEQGTTAWADLTGKPATYPPDTHAHPITDVDGLQAIIDRLTYDSGRRFIHEELLNGWTADPGMVSIQRVGNIVTLTLTSSGSGLDGTQATSDPFWLMPLGFRPVMGNYGHLGWVSSSGARTPVSIIKSLNHLASDRRGLTQGIIMWPTLDPIPTTLPGKP